MNSNAPIGVFDSGIGGMTVVRELISQLPSEQIIYYGDTARVPYGNKSPETILGYSLQIAKFLQSKGVKAILIACNTASAIALEALQRELDIPVAGVVEPGACAAAAATQNGKIGVIATRATISSGIYESYLKKTNPDIEIFKQPCPLFVPLVEEGWIDDEVTDIVIHRYLDGLVEKNIDALVLGCTHYPLLRERIQAAVGNGITLVNPAYESAKAFKQLLEERGLLCSSQKHAPHSFYVSDSVDKFRSFANSIMGFEILDENAVTVKTFE